MLSRAFVAAERERCFGFPLHLLRPSHDGRVSVTPHPIRQPQLPTIFPIPTDAHWLGYQYFFWFQEYYNANLLTCQLFVFFLFGGDGISRRFVDEVRAGILTLCFVAGVFV